MRTHTNAVPLVLTATIVPNGLQGLHSDWRVRRREYLNALDFYRQFGPVYFLENSAYDLLSDAEFVSKSDVTFRKLGISRAAEKGKGFQEFELLDNWFRAEQKPPSRWVKVTGRYVYQNIGGVLDEFAREQRAQMIVDQYRRSRKARTGLFCIESDLYASVIRGMYDECDDRSGEWVELVLFRRLARLDRNAVRLFGVEPGLRGVSGTTGQEIWAGTWHYRLKTLARACNRLFDQRYLWFGA